MSAKLFCHAEQSFCLASVSRVVCVLCQQQWVWCFWFYFGDVYRETRCNGHMHDPVSRRYGPYDYESN